MTTDNIPINIAGIFCYNQQPKNTRVATKEDFFLNGHIKISMYYLLHGYYDNQFEAYKVNPNFNINELFT